MLYGSAPSTLRALASRGQQASSKGPCAAGSTRPLHSGGGSFQRLSLGVSTPETGIKVPKVNSSGWDWLGWSSR